MDRDVLKCLESKAKKGPKLISSQLDLEKLLH